MVSARLCTMPRSAVLLHRLQACRAHRSSCRLASAALALALGQSREEARSIITLKEVEPLIEAMYR